MNASPGGLKVATPKATRHSEVSTGLMLMFLAVMISPIIDIFAKLAITAVPAIEISGARFLIQSLCAIPILIWQKDFGELSWNSIGFHATRGSILALSMISFVATLEFMQVADAIAIFFVEPIMLTILSSIFLKETIGWRRYTACGVGFFGAMLVIQPSFVEVGWVALLPVVSALTIAIAVMMARVRSQKENPWVMQFQSGVWGAIFCAVPMFIGNWLGSETFYFVVPETIPLIYTICAGITASISGILGVYAYRAAPASTLAPLQYFEIVSATVFGWLVFNHFPDGMKWVGIAIIVASGLYIIWRERRFTSKPVSNAENTPLTP